MYHVMFLKRDNVSGKLKNFFKGKTIFLNDMKRGQKKFFFLLIFVSLQQMLR